MNKRKIWRRHGLALILILALVGCGRTAEEAPLPEEETVEGETPYAGQPQIDAEVGQEALPDEEDRQEGLSEDEVAELLEGLLGDGDVGLEGLAISQEESWAVSYAPDGRSLSDSESSIYNSLKTCIEEVASGKRETTQFGLRTAFSKDILSQLDVNKIVFYLLNDCPFDLYWHDKTLTDENGNATDGVYCKYYPDGRIEFSFKVSPAYRKSPDNLYQVNSATMDRVNHAKAKAQAIVDANRASSDYDKLVAYKNTVCDLVTYNAAALASPVYGDDYQVISVFDEDPNTNVVCEGYAKAFKYLCDLSSFDHDISCYLVSGTSDSGMGAGEHMWNVVRLGSSGESYLIDVTNCDAGAIGADYELFMADNPQGSVDSAYTFLCYDWAPIIYTYKPEAREIFGATLLSLGNASHSGQDSLHGRPADDGTDTPAEGIPQPAPTPSPEPTPSPAPEATPSTDGDTTESPEQKPEQGEKPAEDTSTVSFDVTEVNKTYGDDPFVETAVGSEENSKITYKSSDESVALIVNKKGKVRILKPGTATITATDSNGKATASYKLTVAKKPLTWDVSGLYVTDRKEDIGASAEATLFGEMTIEGLLESDKDKSSKFSFGSDDLTATYTSTVSGTQKVLLSWKEGKKRTLSGAKADYYELPEALPELTGKITTTTVLDTPPESTDELTLGLEMEDSISQVPEAFLKDKSLDLDTPLKIQMALENKIKEWESSVPDGNMAVYDVTLRSLDKANDIEGDEGEWVEVADETFPEEGVTVTLPYPKGTSGRMYDFVVCHMFAEDMYLSTPGEVEYPEVTETDKGIQFKVYGLSPIGIGWTETRRQQAGPEEQSSDTGNTQGGQNIDSPQQTDQNTQNSQDDSSKSPWTADGSKILLYLIFAAATLTVICGILIARLRKKKD